MYGYIYKTTNTINGKIYIGQHEATQFSLHYKGSGKALRNAFCKYGRDSFTCEVIEWCDTLEALNDREAYYIALFNSRDPNVGYNITLGGGGTPGYSFTDEVRKRISETSREHCLTRDPEVYQRCAKTKQGNKMMNKDGTCVRVHPEDFESYLADGWVFGGLSRNVDKSGSKNPAYGKSYVRGRVWMHKGEERIYVPANCIDQYLKDGWSRGMKDTNYYNRDKRLLK